jgi:hypothetical protein
MFLGGIILDDSIPPGVNQYLPAVCQSEDLGPEGRGLATTCARRSGQHPKVDAHCQPVLGVHPELETRSNHPLKKPDGGAIGPHQPTSPATGMWGFTSAGA